MKRWFSMKLADNDNDSGEIMIYDMIGKDPWTGDGMDATDFDAELKALGPVKNINLRINSPGGSVMDGVAIYNMIKSHSAKVTASVDGIAASAASLIAMAADNIVMPQNSFMLVHKPRGMAFGTDDDMMAMAGDLERMGATFANAYAERTGQKPADVTALMGEDRLMTASEAKQLGYCDEICSPVKMVAAYNPKLLPALMPKAACAMMTAALDEALAASTADAAAAGAAAAEAAVAARLAEVEARDAAAIAAQASQAVSAAVDTAVAVATYGEAEVHQTLDLCQLAGMASKASAFIKAKTPVDKVREQLLSARAAAADRAEIDTTTADTPKAHQDEWKELQEKVKAEMGIGKRK